MGMHFLEKKKMMFVVVVVVVLEVVRKVSCQAREGVESQGRRGGLYHLERMVVVLWVIILIPMTDNIIDHIIIIVNIIIIAEYVHRDR